MPRKARMIVKGESAVYHVMSHTALDGFVIGDAEKDYLLQLVKHFSSVYFTEVLSFCLMGNHFHLVVRMHPGDSHTEEEIARRFALYYQKDTAKRTFPLGHIPMLRKKWSSLSEFMKEIKQGFSRYYNKRHNRRGFFWSDRFKSVLVEDGDTLINCLAYVDLNPVRAGLVQRPEDYRWNSLGYHEQRGNSDGFLSHDFGLVGQENISPRERLRRYRQFVYEVGSLQTTKGKSIDRFLARTRYFTDSGIIGSREFVRKLWHQLKTDEDNPDKPPIRIAGIAGLYSLKRLRENGDM